MPLRLGAFALVLLACRAEPQFSCDDDVVCVLDDEQGVCTDVGHCAYPDSQCPDGFRFPVGAPSDIAGQCARVDGATSMTGEP
ncbi:MAG: hypothetical protein AAF721_05170 [Myxococcota bacterium]